VIVSPSGACCILPLFAGANQPVIKSSLLIVVSSRHCRHSLSISEDSRSGAVLQGGARREEVVDIT